MRHSATEALGSTCGASTRERRRGRVLGVLVALGLSSVIVGWPATASAQTLVTLDVVAGNGGSCASGASGSTCGTIEGAVSGAEANDADDDVTIDVGVGTYTTPVTIDTADFGTGASLAIEGEAGTPPTLDDGGTGSDMTITAGTTSGQVTVSGLEISGGGYPPAPPCVGTPGQCPPGKTDNGGGVDITAGAVTLSDDTISGDFAGTTNSMLMPCGTGFCEGGGIDNGGSLTLTATTVSGGASEGSDGGGLYNTATATLSDDTFSGSQIMSAIGGTGLGCTMSCDGAGIYNTGTLTMTGGTVSGSMIMVGAGGPGSDVCGASEETAGCEGDGIYNAGTASVTDTTLFDNFNSGGAGGGIYNSSGDTLTMLADTVWDNGASDAPGAGIYNAGTAYVTNTTVWGNSAPGTTAGEGDGGGVYNSGTATLTFDTIAANNALSSGAGIYNTDAVTLTNSLLADNSSSGVTSDCAGSDVTGSVTDIVDDATCTDTTVSGDASIWAPAASAPGLATNGSTTAPETAYVTSASSAVGAVPTADCTPSVDGVTVTTDERGVIRPGIPAHNCDAGAFEFQFQTPTTSIVSATATPSPAVVGEPITFDVSVTGQYTGSNDPTPTGTVEVSDGNGGSCDATLSPSSTNGIATGSCALAEAAPGGPSFSASYGGDDSFNQSSSGSTVVDVGKASPTTSITSVTPTTAVVGEPLTVAVSVTAPYVAVGDPTPSGVVKVSDGTRSCQTVSLVSAGNGTATGSCPITEPGSGLASFTANYPGDGNFTSASSSPTSVTVYETSTTAITSVAASPVAGQPYTVDVVVTGQLTGAGAPSPGGSVEVTESGIDATPCEASLSPSGNGAATGTCTVTEPTIGSYTLSASYPGSGDVESSATSAPTPVTVKASSTTTITSATSSPVVGQPIAFEVSVGGTGATPSGTVEVSDGTNSCQTSSLSGSDGSATASCSIVETAAGSPTFTASYLGDINFYGSTSAGKQVTVAPATSTTTITSVTASPVAGVPLTINVRVTGQFTGTGDPTPSGSVHVSVGATSCTAPLTGTLGVATGSCTVLETSATTFELAVSYAGDSNFDASTANSTLTVGKARTSTVVTATRSPVVGEQIEFSIEVAGQVLGPSEPTPTGNVTVTDGTRTCVAKLAGHNGVANGSCAITETKPDIYSIVGRYVGDSNFKPSNANLIHLTVGKASTKTTLSIKGSPVVYGHEQTLKFDFTITARYPAIAVSGEVELLTGSTVLCKVTLTSGKGACSPRPTALAKRTAAWPIVASYLGNADLVGSKSVAEPLKIT